jgi:hypothetical protein
VYLTSTAFVFFSVLLLSLVLSFYFGETFMEKSSNLNWAEYHAGTGILEENGNRVEIAWWALILSKYVLLYPAVDGMSNFVLCSCSLSEILLGAWFRDKMHDLTPNWKRSVMFHLLSVLPQLIGAALFKDLSAV